jgi:hypothetical protein
LPGGGHLSFLILEKDARFLCRPDSFGLKSD